MMIQDAAREIRQKLGQLYDEGEACAIGDWLLEHLTGTRRKDRYVRREESLDPQQVIKMNNAIERLLKHEPVQYVLSEAWFCGLKFYVDSRVLIPRPETEELVEWIIANCRFPVSELRILDVGCGSGCISISLKRRLGKAEVWGCDQSAGALEVSSRNATQLGVDVRFERIDFLDPAQADQLPSFDIIVSNPPYIPETEKEKLDRNVTAHEPHMALFVPDNDPLVFYRAIARFGKTHLHGGGNIFFEIHEELGSAVSELLKNEGYVAEMKKDMSGKDRMIKAVITGKR